MIANTILEAELSRLRAELEDYQIDGTANRKLLDDAHAEIERLRARAQREAPGDHEWKNGRCIWCDASEASKESKG